MEPLVILSDEFSIFSPEAIPDTLAARPGRRAGEARALGKPHLWFSDVFSPSDVPQDFSNGR